MVTTFQEKNELQDGTFNLAAAQSQVSGQEIRCSFRFGPRLPQVGGLSLSVDISPAKVAKATTLSTTVFQSSFPLAGLAVVTAVLNSNLMRRMQRICACQSQGKSHCRMHFMNMNRSLCNTSLRCTYLHNTSLQYTAHH